MLGSLLSPASFHVPPRLSQSAWHEHAPFAFWLIEALRPRSFVELGVHTGFSYLLSCEAMQRAGLSATACGIDTWRGDEHAGFYGEEVLANLKAYHDPLYAGFSTLIRKTFDEAVSDFDDGSIDLLHIDGRHGYEDVAADFAAWQRKLSTRGVVLFHDTTVFERDFGVHRFWAEIADGRPHFEFKHGHGLGVLGYGSEFPDPLRSLFALDGESAEAEKVRASYARLGAAIGDRYARLEAEQGIQGVNRQLEQGKAEIERMRKVLASAILGTTKMPLR